MYTIPIAIPINEVTILKAIAIKDGYNSSSVYTGLYVTSYERSCLDYLTKYPGLVNGIYSIKPFNTVYEVYCDMTSDGGGWTKITPDLIESTTNNDVNTVTLTDINGGAIIDTNAVTNGCSPLSWQSVYINNDINWSEIKYTEEFRGGAACWGIFGQTYTGGTTANLIPFDPNHDLIRNQYAMGGINGNNFDFRLSRCDNASTNFWHTKNGSDIRSATIIQRRVNVNPSGLHTAVICKNDTTWKYKDIYIR
jgi:hypothetical protein